MRFKVLSRRFRKMTQEVLLVYSRHCPPASSAFGPTLVRGSIVTASLLTILISVTWAAIVPVPQSSAAIKVAVAQVGLGATAQDDLQKVVSFIDQAATNGCRVVVFPEGVLRGVQEPNDPSTVLFLQAVEAEAAADHIYVLLGILSQPVNKRAFNWMVVINPQGLEILRYPKLYDNPTGELPRIFYIDDIPCSAVLCADRWLRGVTDLPVIEGAQISFELSLNFKSEWVPALEWYWYVPRALRHNVYVVFANTAVSTTDSDHCGHSAIVNPSGGFVTRTYSDQELLLVASLDMTKVTGLQASRRRGHRAFWQFWDMGERIRNGEQVSIAPWTRYTSPVIAVTIAAAQMSVSRDPAQNLAKMEQLIAQAAAKPVDVIVFPQLSVTGAVKTDIQSVTSSDLSAALTRVQAAARQYGVYVIFGMPRILSSGRANTAYVIGPDGALLTQYDQMAVDCTDIFKVGACPSRMWFKLKGVPAVVTIGRDKLWSEISEMAAYAGVQLLFNLSYEAEAGTSEDLRRFQVAANFASFRTFSTVVNAASTTGLLNPSVSGSGESTIWEDLTGYEEMQAAVKHTSWPQAPGYQVFASFAANCIVEAGKTEEILYATRTVNQSNPFKEDSKNTRMKPWYWYGAQTITSCF